MSERYAITPAARAVLAAVLALHTETGTWPVYSAIAKRAKIPAATVTYHAKRLGRRGLLVHAKGDGIAGVTDAGRAAAALTDGLVVAPPRKPSKAPLPPHAVVSPKSLAMMQCLRRHESAGALPTQRRLAADLETTRGSIRALFNTMLANGLVESLGGTSWDGGVVRLTPLAQALLDGRVRGMNAQQDRVWRRTGVAPAPIGQPSRTPSRPARKPALSRPEPAPKPIAHTPDAAPLPPPALPALSPAVATWRGIRHPLPPLAHAKPKGPDGFDWHGRTTLKPMRSA